MKDWKGHNNFYTCNRYQKEQKKEPKKDKSKKGKRDREIERQVILINSSLCMFPLSNVAFVLCRISENEASTTPLPVLLFTIR